MRFIDLTGAVFNRVTVLQRAENSKQNRAQWRCRCECGTLTIVTSHDLKSGDTKSCGCLHRETKAALKHGYSKTHIYHRWTEIRQRCLNPNSASFRHYGRRGITVAAQWDDFLQFLQDIGEPPSPRHTIDRINNDGNYEPGNVRWATPSEQNSNTRQNHIITFQGRTQTMEMWAKEIGIHQSTLSARLNKLRWSVKKALSQPVNSKSYLCAP